ncbi:uncharacterized protein TRIADDRAFT_56726 [Trichoplax adhaerens]|uniref:Proteasome assembly chaperone 1 n=1 Tax=Trichoplax adhaerens TaxID=10228 RepID=B3RWF1_TRIAD|nr:hypothetical protein TRIADDRAFT_56726 [Trichoplax adhaerens]EDV25125.1 hypothetical protein TRIADDRAFT_56726 [Trichoplax adhaerens]|eukprot:XP_002113015.1 hypothetical protein TRIADDRAFT_56726 [Trichoplax adhaerens]
MAVNYFARSPFDDLEDDETALQHAKYTFHLADQDEGEKLASKWNCKEIIITFDPASTILLQGYLSNRTVNNIGYFALDGQTSQRHRYPVIGIDNENSILICFCSNKPQDSFQWAQSLMQTFDADKVVLMTSLHQCNYQSMLPTVLPFLRTLKSAFWTENDDITTLEQPNIISDAPAAVLTECQISAKAAVLYICYTESSTVDMQTLKLLWSCLTKSVLQQSTNVSWEELRDIYKKAISLRLSANNIYM